MRGILPLFNLAPFRLLPVCMAAAALLLSVKVGTLVAALNAPDPVAAPLRLVPLHPAAGAERGGDGPGSAGHTAEGGKTPTQAGCSPEAAGTDREHADGAPGMGNGPASAFSEQELKVLEQLRERRRGLDAQAQEMSERSALLDAAEARIDEKVRELKNIQEKIENLVKTYDEQHQAKIASLVKVYEVMKPKDAAKIFEALDMETLLLVADRMSERRLAAIMAELDPSKAKDVTTELARLREVPKDIARAGGTKG